MQDRADQGIKLVLHLLLQGSVDAGDLQLGDDSQHHFEGSGFRSFQAVDTAVDVAVLDQSRGDRSGAGVERFLDRVFAATLENVAEFTRRVRGFTFDFRSPIGVRSPGFSCAAVRRRQAWGCGNVEEGSFSGWCLLRYRLGQSNWTRLERWCDQLGQHQHGSVASNHAFSLKTTKKLKRRSQ